MTIFSDPDLDNILADAIKRKAAMDKARILDKAKETIAERGKPYGGVEDNFGRIARLWNVYLANEYGTDHGCEITPENVASMMALLKLARLANQKSHEDSWVDAAAYVAIAGELAHRGDAGEAQWVAERENEGGVDEVTDAEIQNFITSDMHRVNMQLVRQAAAGKMAKLSRAFEYTRAPYPRGTVQMKFNFWHEVCNGTAPASAVAEALKFLRRVVEVADRIGA